LTFAQCFERLERYVEPSRFDTDALAPQLAGLLIDDCAVADVMLVEGDARMRSAQQLGP